MANELRARPRDLETTKVDEDDIVMEKSALAEGSFVAKTSSHEILQEENKKLREFIVQLTKIIVKNVADRK